MTPKQKQNLKKQLDKNMNWLKCDTAKYVEEIKTGSESLGDKLSHQVVNEYMDDILAYMKQLEDYDETLFNAFNKKYEALGEGKKEQDVLKKEHPVTNPQTIHHQNKPSKQQVKISVGKASSNDLNKLEQNINNSFTQLTAQIQALSNATVIKKELENLQADLSYKIKKQYEYRKDIYEELETLPVTLKNLSTKVDSIQIPSATGSSVKLEIPKDEQAVVNLTKFMKEGLDQFENIARYYITKQSEFDKSDKLNKANQDALTESEKVGIKKGKELERINVATEILDKYPKIFNEIKTMFDDIVKEEYKAGDEIEITQEDRQKLEIKISGIKEVGKITIELPAVLIGGEIVKKATIKEGN